MESCQVSKIEFHGVRNAYPLNNGSPVTCYFTVPSQCKPELGDWIGIYPVGWTTLGHHMCKKMIRPENVWSTPCGQKQCGKIEFESVELCPSGKDQYYQFVYVKNGEYIRGASTPFSLLTRAEEAIYYPLQHQQQQQQQQQQQEILLEQIAEKEMQKLQNNIFGLEQNLAGYKAVFPALEETLEKQTVQGRVYEAQQLLTEQLRIEQAERRIEQLNVLAQLKAYERHINQVQKNEWSIHEYLRSRVPTKLAEFEQKVYQIVKIQQTEQPETYVRKYEQLLKEKTELDIQKRQQLLHKLRQTIRECERKLKDLQGLEHQHYSRFTQLFKTKLHNNLFPVSPIADEVETREQIKYQVNALLNEQRREQQQLVKAQRQLSYLCQEVAQKLQELECSEIYSQLRIPKVQYEQQYPVQQAVQVAQLEQQLNELRRTVKSRLFNQQPFQCQFTTGVSLKPIAQQLRELELTLKQQQYQMPTLRQQPIERQIQNIAQHAQYLEQIQTQQKIEEYKQKELLSQLRQLEGELLECQLLSQPQQPFGVPCYEQPQQQKLQLVACELAHLVQKQVCEKIAQLEQQQQQQQQQFYPVSPVECYIQSGAQYPSVWKQLQQLERKLVLLKAMQAEKQHHQQTQQRLIELEQVLLLAGNGGKYLQQQLKGVEQIRSLRQLLEKQHSQQLQQYQQYQGQQCQGQQYQGQHYLFATPEQYYAQHQQKQEKMWQLVNELEQQVVEQRLAQSPVQYNQYNNQYTIQGGLNGIQQKFERLVQEVQEVVAERMPETVQQRVRHIAQYLRQVQQNGELSLIKSQLKAQQLKEKLAEFETLLCSQAVQQYVNERVTRQVRELKSQCQAVVDDWVLVNNGETPSLFEIIPSVGDYNNNSISQQILSEQTTGSLIDLFTKQSQYEIVGQQQQVCELPTARFLAQEINQECQKLERQFERQLERQLEQQQRQQESLEFEYLLPLTQQRQQHQQQQQQQQQQSLKSLVSVDNLIGELELELNNLRLRQQEQRQQEIYCPIQQQQQQQQQEKQQITTIEPTPFGAKVQQKETTLTTTTNVTGQQQQQQQQTQY